MKKLLFGFMLLFSFDASALDYRSTEISYGGYAYGAWGGTVEIRPNDIVRSPITAMNESVADSLNALDRSKTYKCEIKYSWGALDGSAFAFAVYDIRNCQSK